MVNRFSHHKKISLAALVSLLFVVGGALWAYFGLKVVSSGPFIIHFNDIDGITQLGTSNKVLIVGILGMVMVILNFFLATELEERDRILGKIMAIIMVVVSILLFIGFVAILNVN